MSTTDLFGSTLTLSGTLNVSGSLIAGNITSSGTFVSASLSTGNVSGTQFNSTSGYWISGTQVLSSTSLGSGITNASLQTIMPSSGTLTVSGYSYHRQVCFRAQRTTTIGYIAGQSLTSNGSIVFERTPSGSSGYSSSLGRYTAPISGTYFFTFLTRSNDSTSTMAIRPRQNGNNLIASDGAVFLTTDSGSRRAIVWSDVVYLTAGEYYSIDCFDSMVSQYMYFSGFLISS